MTGAMPWQAWDQVLTEGGQQRPLGEVDERQVDGLADDDVGGVACSARQTIMITNCTTDRQTLVMIHTDELSSAGVRALVTKSTCRRDSFDGLRPRC